MRSSRSSPKDCDTIAAVSTPAGEGGIGIVRISGPEAIHIARALFRTRPEGPPPQFKSHSITHGFVIDPATGQLIDEVLLNVMFAPKTYTMEDTVEINCHGGRAVLQKALEIAIAHGARLADPGEFTKRAFLNGRIDLAQAEAVMELISAKADASLAAALSLLRGSLSGEIAACEEDLLGALANVEASIDFAEEGLETASPKSLRQKLKACADRIGRLIDSYKQGRIVRDGACVVIVGRPNVGKSSLLNAILRYDRAIVSPYPGTTRDTIEESISIKGVPVRLTDTAGIRRARGGVEHLGVLRSQEALNGADLALFVIDGSIPLNGSDREVFSKLSGRRKICTLNKTDLPGAFDEAALLREFPGVRVEKVSALLGRGIDRLTEAIYEEVMGKADRGLDAPLLVRLRHQQALKKARLHIKKALRASGARLSPEFVALDLRIALRHLGEISGRDAGAGLLGKIFEEFCIGK